MDDLLKDFLSESTENLARLDQDIVELERDPSNADLLNGIFRAVHTIKGTCGFLGLPRLERVSHAAESVLHLLRTGALGADPRVISDILRAVDVIKAILAALETTGAEPAGDDAALLATLDAWCSGGDPGSAPSAARRPSLAPGDLARDLAAITADPHTSIAASSLRVNVGVLDALMNLAGELVLTRNQLLEISAKDDGSPYAVPVQQLSRITAEVQGAVMQARMQPVGSAWSKLPRIVRDIARETGKKIELDMKGADTELDRQLVQALQDPLTHMVRNSADHGIERPAERRAAGKSETGSIRLNAYHQSGHVIVEITDDGAGIRPDRVRRKAVERGLVRQAAADAMSDQQVLRFIFEPGFSTVETVTHLSGRGVGMDVVRNNIEKVGGTVDITSTPGAGCTVRIRLPLTLAIISSLLVSAGGEWFAFPQTSVLELVRVPADAHDRFDDLHGARLFRLRDALLPVVTLSALFGLDAPSQQDGTTLVICQMGASRFAVVVDDVVDTQEIVVKPVGRRVRALGCYAGCTILGDGRVIMILDAGGIAALAGIRSTGLRTAEAPVAPAQQDRDTLLLFDAGASALQAVPLSRVARLEEIPASRIERADGRYVVQYRGSLLPVVAASPAVNVTSGQTRAVIVFNDGPASFGLAVNEIRDIVEDHLTIELGPARPGVLGTAVIGGAAAEIIDVAYFGECSRGVAA
ncbi:MAG TPA: chemotaxis protein CheA [Candidatus Elarobacter sp.]|nr:chemotaxis protein CheA [Candidatus Elarobacter sp.]